MIITADLKAQSILYTKNDVNKHLKIAAYRYIYAIGIYSIGYLK